MNGGHFATFKQSFKLRAVFGVLVNGLVAGASAYLVLIKTSIEPVIAISLILAIIIIFSLIFSTLLSKILIKPTEYIAQAIFHVSPNEHLVAAPNIQELSFGKELAENLTRQIYDYASVGTSVTAQPQVQNNDSFIDQAPVGIIGLDSTGNIKLMNKAARDTFGLQDPVGMLLDRQLQIKFTNLSLNDWLTQAQAQSINSNKTWHKVEISSVGSDHRSYYDIAAIYRQGHASGIEVILALFNNNDIFEVEEETLNLISLTVHEIRTPLTIVRGYIDALSEELEGKLNEQDQQYFNRLRVASQNLSTFMSNVLNVVKADQNQLSLNLTEQNWQTTLTTIIDNLRERASVRGKDIAINITGNLPTVALDRVSINEVITNLIDNAIKYSPPSAPKIWVDSAMGTDGMILTTIRDEGVGIPESVIPNLFTRFHRNHRNSKAISGTGLGLFLSKAIVSAHHGNIWIKSHKGQGTTVSFTLLPYSRLADVAGSLDNDNTPIKHGWIKNHSMQRR